MKNLTKENKMTIQLLMAVAVCAVGCGLLIAGFIIDPTGEIHSSVNIAFGETMTFVGALLGIDYAYRWKEYKDKLKNGTED